MDESKLLFRIIKNRLFIVILDETTTKRTYPPCADHPSNSKWIKIVKERLDEKYRKVYESYFRQEDVVNFPAGSKLIFNTPSCINYGCQTKNYQKLDAQWVEKTNEKLGKDVEQSFKELDEQFDKPQYLFHIPFVCVAFAERGEGSQNPRIIVGKLNYNDEISQQIKDCIQLKSRIMKISKDPERFNFRDESNKKCKFEYSGLKVDQVYGIVLEYDREILKETVFRKVIDKELNLILPITCRRMLTWIDFICG